MFEALKESWKKIQKDPPGKRFRRQYRRRKAARTGILNRLLLLGVGLFVIAGGIVFLFTPGPGLLVIFLGLGLIAQESLYLAILLDKLEINMRRLVDWSLKKWRKAHIAIKIIIGIIALAVSAVFAYAMYWYFFIR